MLEALAIILLISGCGFYLAGTVGIVRFPDTYCRLHALTKADNLGLLLICSGLALVADSWRTIALLGIIWLLALLAATVSAHLIARHCSVDSQQASNRSEIDH